MKKILAAIFFCFLSVGLNAATISATINKGQGYSSVHVNGEVIPTSSYIEKTFYLIGGGNSIDFYFSPSAGTITTGNAIWQTKSSSGALTTIATDVIKSGVKVNNFKTDIVTLRFYSNQASSVSVTGSIMIKDFDYVRSSKVKGVLSFTIPTSSTPITITEATMGYWSIRSNKKVYIDFAGGTATSDDFWLNSNDFLDTGSGANPLRFEPGDVIRMIGDTETAEVRGFNYE